MSAGRLIPCVVLWWLLVLAAWSAAAASDPREMLQQMTDAVMAEVHRDPAQLRDVKAVRALAERYIIPHIDFEAAARWVLGKHWRTATTQQRADFVREFRSLLLNTYLRAVSNYQDNNITIMPARGDIGRGRAEVDAEVSQPGGPPVRVGFRLHRAGEEWLVYDISVEGISLVATHRSGFSREISEQGLDNLIRRLNEVNARTAASRDEDTAVAGTAAGCAAC